jgi:DNA-binding NtrC family response regulator
MHYVMESPAMKRVQNLVSQIAACDAPVLISGETGVGKEVVTTLIQKQSNRSDKPFFKVNCAAIPKELVESELFGSMRGAFTSSATDRRGLFEAAHTGTLYLDELSEMTFDLQAKLLRVVEDGVIRRVGATDQVKVDVRIISSVSRPTDQCVSLKMLREDLLYRLGTFQIYVPPLRERKQDIMPLCSLYLTRFCEQQARPAPTIDDEAKALIMDFHWPGNVRQLVNEMHRLAVLCKDRVNPADLDFPLPAPSGPVDTTLTVMEQAEKEAIEKALRVCGGNKLAASHHLGIGRQTLYNRMSRFGLHLTKQKPPGPTGPGGQPSPLP